MLAAHRHGLGGRLDGAWQHHPDRNMPEVRPVGGVRGPAAGIEAHLTIHPRAQVFLKQPRVQGAASGSSGFPGDRHLHLPN